MWDEFKTSIHKYIEVSSNLFLAEVNHKGELVSSNQSFIETFIGEKEQVPNINSLLTVYRGERNSQLGENVFNIEVYKMGYDKIQTVFRGVIVEGIESSLFIFEKESMEDSMLFKQISTINLELSNLTREINKKNKTLKEKNTLITNLMLQDPLTELNNRRYLYEQFVLLLEAYEKEDISDIVLVISDIDKFKEVNDSYGHDVGDLVLKAYADLIKQMTRSEDLRIRFGGDEFMIVFINTPMALVIQRVEKMRQLFSQQTFEEVSGLTASFGLVRYTNGESFQEFVKRGDQALYKAKEKGRNCIVSD